MRAVASSFKCCRLAVFSAFIAAFSILFEGPKVAIAHKIIEIAKIIFPASPTKSFTFSKTVIPTFPHRGDL